MSWTKLAARKTSSSSSSARHFHAGAASDSELSESDLLAWGLMLLLPDMAWCEEAWQGWAGY